MRKQTISLVAAFVLCAAFAAGASAQRIGAFGVKAGLTYATVRGDDVEDVNYQLGFVGGVYATLPLSPSVDLQPEVLYIQKGASFDEEEGELALDYIEVPVLLKFTAPSAGNATPSLYAGPYVAFAVNQEISGEDASVNLEDYLEDTDFGVTLGAGLDFSFSGRSVTLGARYDLGLTNIFEEDTEELAGEAVEAKTGTFSVMLGVAF